MAVALAFDDFNHLGKLIAHEKGHVWGHKDHACDTAGGATWTIMATPQCAEDSQHGRPRFDKINWWLFYGETNPDCDKSVEMIQSGIREYAELAPNCT